MADGDGRILVLGASGLVGRGLMQCGLPGAAWAGRKTLDAPGYRQIRSYGREDLLPLLGQCDTVIHLAALTRDQRPEPLRAANTDLPLAVARWLWSVNPQARFILLSTDLAAYPSSPYGRSKRAAEAGLADLGGDAVCLRASLVAMPPLSGRTTTLESLVRSAGKRLVPVPGGGRFITRPLWIGDLAAALAALAGRRGHTVDQGVWRCEGAPLAYRDLVMACAALRGTQPRLVSVPLSLLRLAGGVLARLNPTTTFPVDFINALHDTPADDPADLFAHLGLGRTPLAEFLPRVRRM